MLILPTGQSVCGNPTSEQFLPHMLQIFGRSHNHHCRHRDRRRKNSDERPQIDANLHHHRIPSCRRPAEGTATRYESIRTAIGLEIIAQNASRCMSLCRLRPRCCDFIANLQPLLRDEPWPSTPREPAASSFPDTLPLRDRFDRACTRLLPVCDRMPSTPSSKAMPPRGPALSRTLRL